MRYPNDYGRGRNVQRAVCCGQANVANNPATATSAATTCAAEDEVNDVAEEVDRVGEAVATTADGLDAIAVTVNAGAVEVTVGAREEEVDEDVVELREETVDELRAEEDGSMVERLAVAVA